MSTGGPNVGDNIPVVVTGSLTPEWMDMLIVKLVVAKLSIMVHV